MGPKCYAQILEGFEVLGGCDVRIARIARGYGVALALELQAFS